MKLNFTKNSKKIVTVVFLILFATSSFAQIKTWNGSVNNNWSNANNWTPNGVPAATDDVIIPNVTTNPRYNLVASTVKSITINNGGVLNFQNNNPYVLTVTGEVTITAGGVFRIRPGGGSSLSTLFVGGNISNAGTLEFVDNDRIDLVLNGTNQTISGAGAYSFNNVTASNNGIVTLSSSIASCVGSLTVSTNSTFRLGVANLIPNTTPLVLNGGTFSNGIVGVSETIGTLGLNDNSIITLGTGNSTLTFANSSAASWISGKALTITGWVGAYNGTAAVGANPKVFVGTTAAGLTASQLDQIQFFNGTNYFSAILLGTGQLVPSAAPRIRSISPTSVCVGSTITLSGVGFTGATAVRVNGVNVASYIINSNTNITATLTATQTSGILSVTTPNGTANSATSLTVNPIPSAVSASPSVTAICLGGTIDLTSSATPNSGSGPVILLNENFNGATNSWTKTNNSSGGTPANAAWTLRPNNYTSTYDGNLNSNDASQFYFSDSDAQGFFGTTATILQSPSFSTIGLSAASFSFYQYYRYIGAESANVEISTNGTSWTSLASYTSNQGAATNFAQVTFNLSGYLNQATVYVRFKYDAAFSYYWAIDNVVVSGVYVPTTYAWTSTPTGFTSTLQNPTGVAPTVNTTYTVTVSNAFGCGASATTASVIVSPVSVGGSVTGGTTICSNATSGLLTLAGHTGTVIRWESAVSPFSTWTPIANTATTYTSGVLTQTTKFRAVVQNGVCNAANSSDTQVSFQSTTWDGASWLNGLPNSATQVIFNGSYTPTSDAALVASATPLVLSACSVVIQSGVVTFPADYVLNVANTVDSSLGSLIFENGASLVQSNDVVNPIGVYNGGNVGNIVYRRTTTKVGLYDYTYWSTPVWPQLLTTMSPDSPNNYYFYFNPLLANWVNINSNNLMDVGKGYIIRAPYYADNTTGYTSNFMGVPNSGTITTPIQIGPTTATPIYREMNLIGNPYPSALSALSFLSNSLNTNVVDATMYFWTHNTPITSNVYNADDYAMFNYSGSVSSTPATATGNNNAAPNGYVASGQSFFIKGINSGGMATFQNNMRGTALTNGQFYRSSTPATLTLENEIIDLERNRFWLDIFNTGGAFKQMMVGYIEQATNAFDRGFDGLTFNSGNVINFYSLINPTTLLGIQGRALPFLTSDVVPLGYSTTINGTFQIQLSNYDAFFNTQNIYLKDKLLNSTHNLKLGNYTFETNAGTFNDRFEIVYENTLQTDTFNETSVVVYKANDVLNIKATNKTISKVEVYDIRGRLLITKMNCNASEIAIDLGTVNQVVLVQITTDDGIMVTKKYVN